MDIGPFLVKARAEIEKKLTQLVPAHDGSPFADLFASARYSLLSEGKRIRPLLVLTVVESYASNWEKALLPACALEMVHTYSLIHDDLPCMDNDDLRRGKPTLHKVYPEWHALLTGDHLLTYAFEVLSNAPELSAEQKISLVRSLSVHAGANEMIGGQFIDLLHEGRTLDWKTLELMHRGKSSGLIIAALEFGGIIADAPKHDITSLKKAGDAIGIAFQLIDDVLDYTGSQEEFGKPIGSDHEKKKATAVSVLGVDKAIKQADLLLKTAEDSLNALSRPTPLLRTLFDLMVNRRK